MKCCICGEEYEGYGNNPWPIKKNENDRCCDACNSVYVVPARMALARKQANTKNENDSEEER